MSKENHRGFWALITTQFQGAFSDNAYKNIIMLVAITMAATHEKGSQLLSIAGGLYVLPFLLFSMAGGYLSNRFSKRHVAISTKGAEVLCMIGATVCLWRNNIGAAIAVLFLTGAQGAFFGPSKYGLLPELLPESKLSWGNGVIEMTTFVAIILGDVLGGFLVAIFAGRLYLAGLVLVALALLGTAISWRIYRVPAANPQARFRLNFLGELFHYLRLAKQDRTLWLAVWGSTYFWFLGFLLLINVLNYGKDTLQLQPLHISYLKAALSLGIGIGSLLAGYLSGNKIEYGLIPLGGMGVTLFALIIGLHHSTFWGAMLLLPLLGFFAGFFIVPLNALLQQRPAREIKGSVLAMANLMTFVGMLIADGLFWLLTVHLHLSPRHIFLAAAALTLVATIVVLRMVPDALMRFIFWVLTHTFYRVRVQGRENIPETGGAMFVANHVSLVDAMLLMASTDRFIRFLMDKDIFELPVIKPVARMLRVIPVSGRHNPRDLIRALREASNSMERGEVVGVFAEGQITRIGQMLPFRKGLERIMRHVDAPIIPIHIDGIWESLFSYYKGRLFFKWPTHWQRPVTVTFGQPMPGNSSAADVRKAVLELGTQAFSTRRSHQRLLHRAFIRTARMHPYRFAATDSLNPKVTYFGLLFRSIFLARLMKPRWQGQKMVGLLLPSSIAGAAANLAATLAGKVAVNLNYTTSQAILNSSAEQCEIEVVLASRQLLERMKLEAPGRVIYVEDLAPFRTKGRIYAAMLAALLMPVRLLERWVGSPPNRHIDEIVTVIFSSGSTGDPKGVLLTHHNIFSNLEGVAQVFAVNHRDRIMGILPFFHSFGYTITLWLPCVIGFGSIYHPNPLDARTIGNLAVQYRATLMVATPTFMKTYIRRCSPEDFGSVHLVMAGAEKLSERVAMAFEEKFGIRPLEGYGCTECSPVVSANIKDFRAPGFYQVGQKRGRIGHPLPGVSVRIVDPETMEPLPPGKPGMLLVKGPNVMQGYLKKPEKTAEAFYQGWYITGDLATVDDDGFIAITDRLSRFSKIGGEMVPHLKVEEALQQLAGSSELLFAVTGVPDEKKGERLVVLHVLPSDDKLQAILGRLAETGLPALWLPRPRDFFRVEQIPVLGTGKLDLRALRELAMKLSAAGNGNT